jgi:uncharacterized protein (TIGR00369 family)
MSFVAQDPEFESRVRASFARQAFMSTLGARLARVAPGEVDIELPVAEGLTQQHGSVHAGAVTSVLDSAAGYAAFSLMPAEAAVVSVEFKVNLLEPARGQRILALGRVLRGPHALHVHRRGVGQRRRNAHARGDPPGHDDVLGRTRSLRVTRDAAGQW